MSTGCGALPPVVAFTRTPSSPIDPIDASGPLSPRSTEERTEIDDHVARLLEQVVDPEPQPYLEGLGLRGRTAIVTGGATGIGRAICFELARHGVNIAFNYHEHDERAGVREDAERTAHELAQMEVRVYCSACDVRDSADVEAFVDDAVEALGQVHILINNAGIGRDRALWRLSDEQWNAVIDTNLTGTFHMIRAVAPHLRRQGDGKIVNISSVHGVRSEFGLANYAASKAGILGLTRSAALELGPSNVNVNAVAPGYIRTTRLTSAVPAEILDRARERAALGRLGDPQDVAHVVVFLCSELARHITGTMIPVDGGYLL